MKMSKQAKKPSTAKPVHMIPAVMRPAAHADNSNNNNNDNDSSNWSALFNSPTYVQESDDSYDMSIDIPNINKNQLRAVTEGNQIMLTINKDQAESDLCKVTKLYTPCTLRTITLPAQADKNNIAASYSDGALHFTIPKLNNNNTSIRTINIK